MTVACGGEIQVMLLSSCSSEQHGGDSSDGSQSMLQHDKKAQTTLFAQRALQERRLKPPDQVIACPRCQSLNTKFCYYNNYSLTQPRHFCKNCRRYWTAGGTLRNVPVGGGCRKNKRAKQRSNDLSSVLNSVESSVSALRGDGGGSALQHVYNPSNASTSAGYYEHQYEDVTKIALAARAQHSIRAGPSGVSQSAEGSGISANGHASAFHVTHGSGMSHSSQSSFETPNIISLGYYQPQTKQQDVAVLANGDLSAIFENQSYRAAAAAAAAAGGGPALGEGGIPYSIDMESLNHNMDSANVQWRLHQAHAAQKQQAIWGSEEEQGHRESRQALHNADEKGLMESLKQAKGKSAITVSPSSGHDQSEAPEVSRPMNVPAWQQVPEPLQTFEPTAHESPFWTNQGWAPLDMQALNPAANTQML